MKFRFPLTAIPDNRGFCLHPSWQDTQAAHYCRNPRSTQGIRHTLGGSLFVLLFDDDSFLLCAEPAPDTCEQFDTPYFPLPLLVLNKHFLLSEGLPLARLLWTNRKRHAIKGVGMPPRVAFWDVFAQQKPQHFTPIGLPMHLLSLSYPGEGLFFLVPGSVAMDGTIERPWIATNKQRIGVMERHDGLTCQLHRWQTLPTYPHRAVDDISVGINGQPTTLSLNVFAPTHPLSAHGMAHTLAPLFSDAL